jgi:hypothetical protein
VFFVSWIEVNILSLFLLDEVEYFIILALISCLFATDLGRVHAKVVREKEPEVGLGYQTPNYRRLQMDYNTEMIESIAQQLAEMLKQAVNAQQMAGQKTQPIAQIEADMREVMGQIGNQALGMFLSSMQTTPASEISCKCGGILHYQRMREATVISVFGKTSYERAYYAGCTCQKGKAPLAACPLSDRLLEMWERRPIFLYLLQ